MKQLFNCMIIFLATSSIFAQEPLMKFYLHDGNSKTYNIKDIEEMSLKNISSNLLIKLYYDKTKDDVYPAASIDKIEFGKDSLNADCLIVYIFGTPKIYAINNLDSIIFNYLDLKVRNDVTILDSIKSIDLISSDSTKLIFGANSETAHNLSVGDVLTGEPSQNAPNGFLRRVISTTIVGDSISINTEDIKLTDVIENGIISFNIEFSPQDTLKKKIKDQIVKILADEGFTIGFKDIIFYDENNISKNIKFDGKIIFTPKLGFNLVVEHWKVKQLLVQLSLETSLDLTAHSNLEKEKTIQKSLNKLLGIGPIKLPSVVVNVGICPICIPVTITSNIDLQVGLSVKIGAEVSSGINLKNSVLAGIEYNSGVWKKISEQKSSYKFSPFDLSVGGSVKMFLGPQLNTSLYGEQDALNTYVNVFGFSELEVDLLKKPLWMLWAGIEANAGVKSEWWKNLDYELPYVIEYRKLLAQSADLISSVTPSEAKVGETISIKGKGFGDTKGGSYVRFKFGNSMLPIDAIQATDYIQWSDEEIKVKVPNGLSVGEVKLIVNVGGFHCNITEFTIIPKEPKITNIVPNKAVIGDVITLNGVDFTESGVVYFNSLPAMEYITRTDTEIKVKVPDGAKTGKLFVRVDEKNSNEIDITIEKPATNLTSISPNPIEVGELLIITGNNFGDERESNYVNFPSENKMGIIATDYTSWSDTEIKVKVPEGAKTGKLFVKVGEKNSNEIDITINISTAKTCDMVLIPAGTFLMGDTGGYYRVLDDEKPVHTVTISKAFYMSKYEVTQKQYQAVMGTNPSYFKGENLPVEHVSWYDAVAFCNTLSQLEGLTPCYTINGIIVTCNFDANGYRLPTEAEWEYAAKAGTTTDYYNGSLTNDYIDPNLDNIAWYSGNSSSKTQPVGQKQPNAFGLYDMSGNVLEWCWDWFSSYTSATVTDPNGPVTGSDRVRRGGSWNDFASICRSANRYHCIPGVPNYDAGFRVVSPK